jgi:nickel-dependent lactate racemase
MPSQNLSLPWGKEKINLALPEQWNLLGIMEPAALAGVPSPIEELERSLANPIASPRLADLARPEMSIALVIDDDSRPTPVALVLPAVMAELSKAGVSEQQITVIPALGVHRPMTPEEVAHRTGMPGLKIETHDCDDLQKLTYLGLTSRGTPVYVNHIAARADLVISIGCIEPHIIASFGGGYKNLIPGIAGRTTIAHNHAINCQPASFNNVGQPIEHNGMRLDLEECGRMFKPPVFIINTVLNSALEVVKVVAGHPVEAHRAGAAVSAGIYGASIPAPADIVITSSNPMDQDLRQGVKALANTIRALKPGGVMICLVRAEEGVGVFGLANRKLPLGRRALKLLAPLILPLVPRLKLKGMGEEDRFFLYFALQVLRHGEILMFAPTIPASLHDNLPFLIFKESVEAALEHTRRRYPGPASVLVFPNGGSTYPILP